MQQIFTQTCVYDYQSVAGALDSYPVVSSSTCAVLASDIVANPVSYYDFAFFGVVALFLLAFVPAGFIWSIFKPR